MLPPAEDPTSLGNLFLELGLITQEQVNHVIAYQAAHVPAPPFGEVCVQLGLLSAELLREILEQQQALRADHERKPALVAQRMTSATSRAGHLTESLDTLTATAQAVANKLR